MGQGHEDTHNEKFSCTSESHEVMPELRINAPSWIGQGHEAIHIISLSCIGQGHEVMPELRMNAPAGSGKVMKLYT